MYIFLTNSVLNLRVIVFILLSNLIFTQTKNSIKNILIDKEYDSKSFFVGATIGHGELLRPNITQLFLSEFTYLTPANSFKQTAIHPRPGVWNWKKYDDFIDFAEKNNLTLRVHGPVSPQASKWAKNDNRTKEELLKNMEEFFTELCIRLNDEKTVKWMDVVNETVLRNGEWFKEKPGDSAWENPWTQIGLNDDGFPIYIVKAFEIANKHAPNVKLVYNHNGGMERKMWEKVLETITYLKNLGLRVDGIGWQAHLRDKNGVGLVKEDLNYLSYLIDWTHANSMEFHVTELNYWLNNENPKSISVQKRQVISYNNIVNTLISKKNNGVVTLNIWGLFDRKGPGDYPKNILSLYDQNGNPKQSLYAIKKSLINESTSLIFEK